jgi:hypothetical protein
MLKLNLRIRKIISLCILGYEGVATCEESFAQDNPIADGCYPINAAMILSMKLYDNTTKVNDNDKVKSDSFITISGLISDSLGGSSFSWKNGPPPDYKKEELVSWTPECTLVKNQNTKETWNVIPQKGCRIEIVQG